MSIRVAFSADWHLGQARNRLDPETGLNAALIGRYRCARFCVEDAIARGAQVILHGGDVFHGCRPTPTEVRLAKDALAPALDHGIPVVIALGNHDAPRSPSERHALDLLRDTDGLCVADEPTMLLTWLDQSQTDAGQIRVDVADACPRLPLLQLAVLPWPNAQLLLADADYRALDPGQLQALVREKMMDVARGLAARLAPRVPSVLLAHCSVDLAEAGGMNRLMALGSDWTLNLHELTGLGFDAVLLGHIHKPQVLHGDPLILYPGSPECIDQGEAGEGKLYMLLDFGGPEVIPEAISTPHTRFRTVDIIEGDGAALFSPVTPDLAGQVVRVRIAAGADVDQAALRRELEAVGVAEFTIEVERPEAKRRETAITVGSDVPEALAQWVGQNPDYKPMLAELVAEAQGIEAGGDER